MRYIGVKVSTFKISFKITEELRIKDLPFHLETLKDIHRLVQTNGLMVTFDDKSGYDHVKLNPYVYPSFGLVFSLLCLLKE
jgi:hypothetical protein